MEYKMMKYFEEGKRVRAIALLALGKVRDQWYFAKKEWGNRNYWRGIVKVILVAFFPISFVFYFFDYLPLAE